MSDSIRLFGLARSVYTRIARLTLEEKNLAYTLEEVEIFGASGVPASHLERHPFSRIPVLQQGEFLLYETTAITRYIGERFSGPSLQPSAHAQRARMNQVVSLLDSYAYRPMVWGVFVERVRIPLSGGIANEDRISTSLQQADRCLSELARLLDDQSFFAGDSISLADLHAYPMLCYFALAPEGRARLDTHPTLARWFAQIQMRDSVVRTRTPYEPR
jgi:glutathione S-transferase